MTESEVQGDLKEIVFHQKHKNTCIYFWSCVCVCVCVQDITHDRIMKTIIHVIHTGQSRRATGVISLKLHLMLVQAIFELI